MYFRDRENENAKRFSIQMAAKWLTGKSLFQRSQEQYHPFFCIFWFWMPAALLLEPIEYLLC
jgi:hypothetical protein